MNVRSSHPIARLLARQKLRVLGINTGTSIDGLDYALVEIGQASGSFAIRIIETGERQFPKKLAKRLRTLAENDTINKAQVSQTHIELGMFIGDTINRFRERGGRPTAIDLIGSHGQTIGHFPGAIGTKAGRRRGASATWQIGSVNAIAQSTKLVTIGDFRIADTCTGGQGAPLSGYYHHLIFGKGKVVLNLGGIANLSASRMNKGKLEIRAFDTGPGNMLSDALARTLLGRPYDHGGHAAAQGEVRESLVSHALRDRYFSKSPPKTCGREQFGAEYLQRYFGRFSAVATEDLLATAIEITARTCAMALQRWMARFTTGRSLILAGGGVKNQTLVRRLTTLLPQWDVTTSDAHGIAATSLEPTGFALLAHATLNGQPGNSGGATGGSPAVLGMIALPLGGKS